MEKLKANLSSYFDFIFRNKIEKSKLIIIMLSVITFIINIIFVSKCNMIYMSGDEYGPIAIAAYWSGEDWSSTNSLIGYYSYGYSLILYPFFRMITSPVVFYRSAIALNALFTACIVPISYYIEKRICPNIRPVNSYICSFFLANSIFILSRSRTAWCETLLIFLFWLLCLYMIKIEENLNYKNVFIGTFLSIYMYVVHQRMIGVLVAFGITLFFICRKQQVKGFRFLLEYILEFVILFALHINIKAFVKSKLWLDVAGSNGNDYQSVISNFTEQLNMDGLKDFLYTINGHFFYICVTSAGIAVIGLIILCKKLNFQSINLFRKNKIEKHLASNCYYLFFLLSFVFSLIISAVFMNRSISDYVRSDHLVYGRYVEPVLGIIILISIVYLLEYNISKREMCLSIIIIMISLTVTIRRFEMVSTLPFNTSCSVGMFAFLQDGKLNYVLIALLIATVFGGLCIFEKLRIKQIIVVLFSVYSIVVGSYFVYVSPLKVSELAFNTYMPLIETKITMDKNADFYYIGKSVEDSTFVQYLLKGKQSLKYVYEDNYLSIPEQKFYAITTDINFLLENKELKVVARSKNAYLITNDGSISDEAGIDISFSRFYSKLDENFEEKGEITSYYETGHLLFGPYISLDPGKYEVKIKYSSQGNFEDVLGEACVRANSTQTKYVTKSIESTSCKDDVLALQFELSETVPDMEFIVTSTGIDVLSIKGISVRRIE